VVDLIVSWRLRRGRKSSLGRPCHVQNQDGRFDCEEQEQFDNSGMIFQRDAYHSVLKESSSCCHSYF
jgi:hypothetical protein